MTEEIKLIRDGLRLDGRRFDQLRPIEAAVGVLKRADGSALFKLGNSMAIAGVYGPRAVVPKHEEEAERAVLRCTYRMAPFSTQTRARPGPTRRTTEISMVTRLALEPVVFLDEFPKTAIDVVIEILQADASTRCVGINAASLALADAGVPMADLIASCSAGIIDNQVVLDIAGLEDMEGMVDMPIAYWPRKKMITLLQMDGLVDRKKFKEMLSLAISGCEQIYEVQKSVLRKKYEIELPEV